MLACGPPHGRPCCFVVWPPSWWGVLCRCVAPLMVGRAVLVFVRRGGCAWCGGPWLGLSSCVPPGGRRRWIRVGGACGGVLAGAMRGLFCLFGVVFAALRLACSGGFGWRLGCGCGRVDRLAGVGSVLLRGPPHGGACCVGACPPPRWGVLCWCVAPPMVGRAALVCGPPLGGACCVGVWPPSWWGVLCSCPSAAVGAWCGGVVVVCWVAFAVVLFAWPGLVPCWCVSPPLVGVCCACASPPPRSGVLSWCVPPPRGGACCVGLWPPHGGACCVGAWPPSPWGVLCLAWVVVICWVGCGCGCVVGLAGVGVVLVRAPSPVGACPVCACPPPWWGVLCRRVWVLVRGVVAGWMLGLFCWFAVVSAAVRPALSAVGCLWCLPGRGWCCAGACPPPLWWGVLRWFVAPLMMGRAVLVRGPPLAGACCVGARLPRWWCLVWVVVFCSVGFGCGCVVGLARVGAVLVRAPPPCWGVPCLCVAPPLEGHAVWACSGFGSWCCSRLDARLVLLVRCCLRRRTAGVVGCRLSVLFAWPGLVLCWCVPCPPPPCWGVPCLFVAPPLGGVCCSGVFGFRFVVLCLGRIKIPKIRRCSNVVVAQIHWIGGLEGERVMSTGGPSIGLLPPSTSGHAVVELTSSRIDSPPRCVGNRNSPNNDDDTDVVDSRAECISVNDLEAAGSEVCLESTEVLMHILAIGESFLQSESNRFCSHKARIFSTRTASRTWSRQLTLRRWAALRSSWIGVRYLKNGMSKSCR